MTSENVSEHSDIVGGSSAGKRLACPGSYQMELKLPISAKSESSRFADEGTAMHDAMAYILTKGVEADEVLGMEFGREGAKYVITKEMMVDCIYPALDYFDALTDRYVEEDGDFQFYVEQRVEVPGIPGAFGTSDIVFRTPKRGGILDWKFGAGVPVKASYDGKPNPQLLFYARGAMHTLPGFFGAHADWPVDIHIAQPRGRCDEYYDEKLGRVVTQDEQRYTMVTVTQKDLEDFRWALVHAVVEAKGKDPKIAKGDHCRFASCKTVCPLWTGPALDLTKALKASDKTAVEAYIDDELDVADREGVDWGEVFADWLDVIPSMRLLIAEIEKQALEFAEQGGTIPDYKLGAGRRGNRSWKDEDKAEKWLARQGIPLEERRVTMVISVAVAEKVLKKLGKELSDKYVDEGAPGKTVLMPADDHRKEVIPPATLARQLGQKLAALQ